MNSLISFISCLILISGTGTISEIEVTEAEIKNTNTGEVYSLAAFIDSIDRSFLLEIRDSELTTTFIYKSEPFTGIINQKGFDEILLREYTVTNGTASEYFPNAKPATRVIYQNGYKHGIWESYYPNGQLAAIGYYIENRRSGTWYSYFENGNIEW